MHFFRGIKNIFLKTVSYKVKRFRNGGNNVEDERIINLYWRRDEQAITETDKKYGALCSSIAYGILASSEDAEACVSDTYGRLE